jgi:glc operon protein GlcG
VPPVTVDWLDQPPRPTLAASERAATAAIDCAVQRGIAIAIAIVDSAGRPICLKRMDGARPVSAELALAKACAAATFERATHDLQTLAAPGAPAFGAQFHPAAGAGILPGGLPLLSARGLLGAVGASGADRDGDIACATAACLSLTQTLQE